MSAAAGWPPGIYRMTAQALPLYLVIVPELERSRETLMLRLMGRERVLRAALEDLRQLPAEAWERRAAVDAVRVLRSPIDGTPTQDPDEEAIIVTASEIYEQVKDEGRQEGREQGRQEGRQEGVLEGESRLLLRMLTLRFGPLSDPIVQRVRAAAPAQLEAWAERLLKATALDQIFEEHA